MKNLVRQFKKENLSQTLKISILNLILVLSILFSQIGLSQSDDSNNPSIFSKSGFESSSVINTSVVNDFKSNYTTIKPAIHIENNVIKISNPNPVCLFLDITSISNINALLQENSTIEYISIRVKRSRITNNNVQLDLINSYPNLKYVHIIFEYEISDEEMITKIINPVSNTYTIFESRKLM